MRTLIDIDEAEIGRLDELAARAKQSRAALVRQAISEFLGKRRGQATTDAFGLWSDREVDGLAYQRKLRAEW
jgi:predicted transcriptional regulator